MVHFVGAGPGGPDLITLRGAELLRQADCVVYAGSLVNPALLGFVREHVPVYNSAHMTLEQVIEVLERTEASGGNTGVTSRQMCPATTARPGIFTLADITPTP